MSDSILFEQLSDLKRALRPTLVVPGLATIDTEEFLGSLPTDTGGVTWDLDKTLVGQHEEVVPEAHVELLRAVALVGLRQAIVSNANSPQRALRVAAIGDGLSRATGAPMHIVTSSMVSGQRKPKRPIFDEAGRRMRLPNTRIVHVGDQLFKDVLGANRAGYGATVLVPPYGEGDDPRVRFVQRPLERLVRRTLLGLPYHDANLGR